MILAYAQYLILAYAQYLILAFNWDKVYAEAGHGETLFFRSPFS
jgi:hypothetical protein